MNKKLSQEQINKICARYQAGEPSPSIAREYGLNPSTVRDHLKRRGIEITRNQPLTEAQVAQLTAMYQEGKATPLIAETLNTNPSTVSKYVKRAGLTIRSHKEIAATKRLYDESAVIAMYNSGCNATEIATTFKIKPHNVYDTLERHGIQRRNAHNAHSIYTLDENVFDIVNEESAYWIGFLMADGCLYQSKKATWHLSVFLAERDRGHLEKLQAFLGSSHPLVTRHMKNSTACGFRVSSRKIAEALMRFGVTPRKSKTAQVANLENDRHFWRGVVDGDGCLYTDKRYGTVSLSVIGSSMLMEQFAKFIRAHTDYKANVANTRKGVFQVTAGMGAIEILYSNCTTALDRKREIAEAAIIRIEANRARS